MWTTAQIRRHISNLPNGTLFTTRELLSFGSRPAVDQALYRLVKSGEILRMARGVFVRPCSCQALPTVLEVAKIKAESFGRKIVSHAADLASELGLRSCGNREPTFATNGRSSTFRFGDTKIRFVGTSPRKIQLGDSPIGVVIRALWSLGRSGCGRQEISMATQVWGRDERRRIRRSSFLLPAWMDSLLKYRSGVSQMIGSAVVPPL